MNSDHLLTSLADKSTYEVEAFANENSNRILQISLEAANMDLRFVKEVSDLHERVSAQIRDNLSSGQLVASVGELTPLYTKINQALLILNNLKARFEADYTSLTAVVTKAKAMSEIDSSEKREWQMVASHASTLAANSANTGLLLESRATDLLDLKGRLQALQVSITQKIQATATR